ncbi:unnamed protein product [Vitrella brassicaformis CCMP3155]|uniref:Abnormal spindle-like microcephaly-associated protein ASH domain-containing protein n=1 Tax=Vitrella brassicaformis (strain CCMP3155) TaxID=1169540 RepID=A0A0G4ETD1_VITBC|nr:unnamed protein product [Vitrella brassicaformis CCMP3155]|mmetsp:Transcript_7579/g.21700  ORF Transcript_7579/g.21700 Transcript_7579/m.21700 type:complete len:248 (-) Transcript_7579:1122-1865(-)|eukprot:CEM01703.1 unnamed protein product [Vitrella brassicaformis CCMP3155]
MTVSALFARLVSLGVVLFPSALAQVSSELPTLLVIGNAGKSKCRVSVGNLGPGSVNISAIDSLNETLSTAVPIMAGDTLTRVLEVSLSSGEVTFIFTAENGTELLRQTLTSDFSPESPTELELVVGAQMLEATFDDDVMRLGVRRNYGPFDLLLNMKYEGNTDGRELGGNGTVIRRYSMSDWLGITFTKHLWEGDSFYASLAPKDKEEGTGPLVFVAMTNWRTQSEARRGLRAEKKAAIDRMFGFRG